MVNANIIDHLLYYKIVERHDSLCTRNPQEKQRKGYWLEWHHIYTSDRSNSHARTRGEEWEGWGGRGVRQKHIIDYTVIKTIFGGMNVFNLVIIQPKTHCSKP